MSSTLCWLTIAQASEVIYVPDGYTVETDGYFMPEAVGREVLEAWKTDKEQKLYYKEQLELVLDKQAETYALLLDKMDSLESRTQALIAEKDKQIKTEKAKARRPGLGLFAGLGKSTGGDVDAVIGVGLVWKLF